MAKMVKSTRRFCPPSLLAALLLLCFFPVSSQQPTGAIAPPGTIHGPCSFTDQATGFYASWHTNCSGIVNFVINVHNFPRTDMMPSGFPGAFGRFWIGIGFQLVSTELALVENLFDGFVSVAQARLDDGRPPLRQLGAGILINPRGAFFGTTLEATFSIDESLLRGCKEFLFFTAPTPVGAPYGAQPYARQVCDVARTCSRWPCASVGGYGAPAGMGMGTMDYIGTGSAQDPTIPMMGQQMLADEMMMMSPGYGSAGGFPGYGGGGYGMMNPLYPSYSSALGGLYGGYGLGSQSYPGYGGYGGGAIPYSGYGGSSYGYGGYNPYYGGGLGSSLSYGSGLYGGGGSMMPQNPMVGSAAYGGYLQNPMMSAPYSTNYWGGFLSPLKAKKQKRMMLE